MRGKSDADFRGVIFAMFVICLLLLVVVVVDGDDVFEETGPDEGEELPCSEFEDGLDLIENRSSSEVFDICRNLSSGEIVLCRNIGD